jgi:mobilization protein NikA
MKIVSIRMADSTWDAIQTEALRAGISASEFIREAAVWRIGYRYATRMDDDALAERLRALGLPLPDEKSGAGD